MKHPEKVKFRAKCWQCGKDNNHAAAADPNETQTIPENNDLLMCFYCGAFMVVDDTMYDNVHKPTPAENFEIKNNEYLQKMYHKWLLFKMQHERKQ